LKNKNRFIYVHLKKCSINAGIVVVNLKVVAFVLADSELVHGLLRVRVHRHRVQKVPGGSGQAHSEEKGDRKRLRTATRMFQKSPRVEPNNENFPLE
jgi:hypothetical protein